MMKLLFFPFRLVGWLFGLLFGFVPPIRRCHSGEDFEAYVALILKKSGYKKVTMTNKNDYGIDLLALKHKKQYGFQCKFYSKPVGVSAVQQVVAGGNYYHCDDLVVVTNNTFTKQAITLATSNLVTLWDGDDLNQMRLKANGRSLFKKAQEDVPFKHPYLPLLETALEYGVLSIDILKTKHGMSDSKAYYVLEDLVFYDLIEQPDHYGIYELRFNTLQQAIDRLKADSD